MADSSDEDFSSLVKGRLATISSAKEQSRETQSFVHDWFLCSIPSIAFLGCQLAWSLQMGFVTSELQLLGLPQSYISYVWLAGPISGIVVQPIVGVISDRTAPYPHSRCGKRVPFILIGAIAVAASLIAFSNARFIGAALNGTLHFNIGLVTAIIAFWVLDFSINISQAPLRALIADIIPIRFHKEANAQFGIATGIGSVLGNGLGFLLGYDSNTGGGLTALYGSGAVLVLLSMGTTAYFVRKEKPLRIRHLGLAPRHIHDSDDDNHVGGDDDDDDNSDIDGESTEHISLFKDSLPLEDDNSAAALRNDNDSTYHRFKQVFMGLSTMPSPLKRAWVVQFWTYFAHYGCFVYLTDWYGKEVAGGNPVGTTDEVRLYESGVKTANMGLVVMSVLSIFISLSIPKLLRITSLKLVWMTSMAFFAGNLWALYYVKTPWLALVCIAALSLPLSAHMVVPWIVVTETLENSNDRGLYTTVFNLAQCLPDVVVCLVAGWVISTFGNNVSSVMAFGGCGAIVTFFCTFFVIDPQVWKERKYEPANFNVEL